MVLDGALEQCPNHLPREWTVRFALFRDAWTSISILDLQSSVLAADFRGYRNDLRLKEMIRSCEEADRMKIRLALPAVVGDYYLEQRHYAMAVEAFVAAEETESAVKATDRAIEEAKRGDGDITRVVRAWEKCSTSMRNKNLDAKVADLLDLFQDPREAAKKGAERLLKRFGPETVRRAVLDSGTDGTLLHAFDRVRFEDDVKKALIQRYTDTPIAIVEWYLSQDDRAGATSYAQANLADWSAKDLLDILGEHQLRPKGIELEIQRRGALLEGARLCLQANSDIEMAEKLSNMALASDASDNTVNARKVWALWKGKLNDSKVKRVMTQRKGASSKIILLLKARRTVI